MLKKVGCSPSFSHTLFDHRIKALCIARLHHYQYRGVIDVLSGILFLGTPHTSLGQSDSLDVLSRILRSRPKSRLKKEVVKYDRESLQALCQDFEMAKLRVPILSAYEAKGSKMHSNPLVSLWKNRTVIVR